MLRCLSLTVRKRGRTPNASSMLQSHAAAMGAEGARWPPRSSKPCGRRRSRRRWVRLPCALATQHAHKIGKNDGRQVFPAGCRLLMCPHLTAKRTAKRDGMPPHAPNRVSIAAACSCSTGARGEYVSSGRVLVGAPARWDDTGGGHGDADTIRRRATHRSPARGAARLPPRPRGDSRLRPRRGPTHSDS